MSAASVSAYLSPTILRNFATRSLEREGEAAVGCTMFIFLASRSFPPDGRAAQPVVDGFAEPVGRDWHHRNRPCRAIVERAKITEKIGRGFRKIPLRRQIHDGSCLFSARERRAEGEQRFAGFDRTGIEAHACARRIMR